MKNFESEMRAGLRGLRRPGKGSQSPTIVPPLPAAGGASKLEGRKGNKRTSRGVWKGGGGRTGAYGEQWKMKSDSWWEELRSSGEGSSLQRSEVSE